MAGGFLVPMTRMTRTGIRMRSSRAVKRSIKAFGRLNRAVFAGRSKAMRSHRPRPTGLNLIKSLPYPRSAFLRLKYHRIGDISSVTTQNVFGSKITFHLNDLLVPKIGQAAGDPLPYGTTQLSEMYRKYRVYGVKYHIIFSDGSADGIECAIYARGSKETHTIDSAALSNVLQLRNVRTSMLNNTGEQERHMRGYIDIRKIEGTTKYRLSADDAYEGDITSSLSGPSLSPTLEIAIANRTADATARTCRFQVFLEYLTRLYECIDLNPSTS